MPAEPATVPLKLSPGEWAVLGAIGEGPTHGFALARLLAPDGTLGQVWTLPRPVVYQSLHKLVALDLVAPLSTERSERGPSRTIVGLTAPGTEALDGWLATPVAHVRDIRSELLLKLALIDRRGVGAGPLVAAQRTVLLARHGQLLESHRQAAGFERVLVSWRIASVQAVLDFLDTV